MKQILNYHTWTHDFPIAKVILQDIQIHKPDIIKIFALEEFDADSNWRQFFLNDLKSKIEDNIKFEIFLGSYDTEYYKTRYNKNTTLNFYFWPYFFLFYTFCSDVMDGNTHSSKQVIKSPYISFNSNPRHHRCLLLDLLAKNELLEKGNVSWNPINKFDYEWVWWKSPKKKTLSDNYSTTRFQYGLPIEWNESFVNLISETSVDVGFITEKTWIPILCKKPFLVQTREGFYDYFQQLGFKVYDEIFDYSFDSVSNLEVRTQMILDNVKNILDNDYQKLYDMIYPKIKHNYNRALELIQDKNIIPDFMINDEFAKDKYFGFIMQANSLLRENYFNEY
jgi:hypothetical protein